MSRLMRADFARLRKSIAFRLVMIAMIVLTGALMIMQATSMDYTVPLSRVIFLPVSMYGIFMAAFVSTFSGEDFSDGFIRNKLITVTRRSEVALSQIIVNCVACSIVYVVIIVFSSGVGQFFFENNVNPPEFIRYFLLGMGMSMATGSLYVFVTMLCCNKTHAIIWNMGMAFCMLFLCLHTNSILVQPEYKNGILNPHYVGGFCRTVYSFLHDLNLCGQAAQLSAWEVWHPIRILFLDLLLIIGLSTLGCILFRRKDIN